MIALLFLPSSIRAPATGAREVGWSGAIEASANVLFGAARGRLVALKAGTQRADSTFEVQGDVLLSHADARTEDEEREVTARSVRVSLGVDHPEPPSPLTETTRLEHVTFYQPTVERFARYIAESTTSLAVTINARVALTGTLRDRYDSESRSRRARSNHAGQLLFGARGSF